MQLLSTGNPKLLKGEKKGYLSFILHLAPATLSGYQTCPKATKGCEAACLNTAGRGGMFKKGETTNVIQQARIRKTRMFFENRAEFLSLLVAEIRLGIKQASKKGLIPCFRLNGASDIRWENYGIMEQFPDVQFYDYTKITNRKTDHVPNYHLTFSRAESNDLDARLALKTGMNIAAVFTQLPETYAGKPVINGDETDLRFLDPKGVVVGLKAKGRAKKDSSGFVIRRSMER